MSQHCKKGKRGGRRKTYKCQHTEQMPVVKILTQCFGASVVLSLWHLMGHSEKMEVKVQLGKMKLRIKVGCMCYYLSFRPPKRRDLYGLSLGMVSTRFSFEEGKFSVYSVWTFPS